MALRKKDVANLIKGLHQSNKDHLVRTFNLTEAEAEFLFEAWKGYCKEHPEAFKESAIRCFDSFLHGYLAYGEFVQNLQSRPAQLRPRTHRYTQQDK